MKSEKLSHCIESHWPKVLIKEPIGLIKRPQLIAISLPILFLGGLLCHYEHGNSWFVAIPTFMSLLHVVFCFIEITVSQSD